MAFPGLVKKGVHVTLVVSEKDIQNTIITTFPQGCGSQEPVIQILTLTIKTMSIVIHLINWAMKKLQTLNLGSH